eukprot:759274-Hanusia_phi.AAC.2
MEASHAACRRHPKSPHAAENFIGDDGDAAAASQPVAVGADEARTCACSPPPLGCAGRADQLDPSLLLRAWQSRGRALLSWCSAHAR